jgi:hypothetical protein
VAKNFANISFDFGGAYISHEKLQKEGKVICHLGFISKVLPGPLTGLSA